MISVPQQDPLIYRTLTEGPLWDQMLHVVDELLASQSRVTYYNLKHEIMGLKDVENLEELLAQEPEFVFTPATEDGQKIFSKLKNGYNFKSRALRRKVQNMLPKQKQQPVKIS